VVIRVGAAIVFARVSTGAFGLVPIARTSEPTPEAIVPDSILRRGIAGNGLASLTTDAADTVVTGAEAGTADAGGALYTCMFGAGWATTGDGV